MSKRMLFCCGHFFSIEKNLKFKVTSASEWGKYRAKNVLQLLVVEKITEKYKFITRSWKWSAFWRTFIESSSKFEQSHELTNRQAAKISRHSNFLHNSTSQKNRKGFCMQGFLKNSVKAIDEKFKAKMLRQKEDFPHFWSLWIP